MQARWVGVNRTHTEDEVRFGAYDALSRSLSVDDIGVGHGAFTSTHDGVARTGRSVVVQYVQLLWCRGGKLRRSGGGLSASASLARWMLDERYDATGHEPGRSYGLARAGYLDDFDDAPTGRDFDAATRARSNDLVGARTVVGGDDNLHAIALHVFERSSARSRARCRALAYATAARPRDNPPNPYRDPYQYRRRGAVVVLRSAPQRDLEAVSRTVCPACP